MDLINRDTAIDLFLAEGLITAAVYVERMPSAEKTSEWVVERDNTVMHCNHCGWAYEYYAGLEEEWNYCPHCGARMVANEH